MVVSEYVRLRMLFLKAGTENNEEGRNEGQNSRVRESCFDFTSCFPKCLSFAALKVKRSKSLSHN